MKKKVSLDFFRKFLWKIISNVQPGVFFFDDPSGTFPMFFLDFRSQLINDLFLSFSGNSSTLSHIVSKIFPVFFREIFQMIFLVLLLYLFWEFFLGFLINSFRSSTENSFHVSSEITSAASLEPRSKSPLVMISEVPFANLQKISSRHHPQDGEAIFKSFLGNSFQRINISFWGFLWEFLAELFKK